MTKKDFFAGKKFTYQNNPAILNYCLIGGFVVMDEISVYANMYYSGCEKKVKVFIVFLDDIIYRNIYFDKCHLVQEETK